MQLKKDAPCPVSDMGHFLFVSKNYKNGKIMFTSKKNELF
jgi:hypothetical protein